MQFTINLNLFKELVRIANFTVPSKPSHPVLGAIKITADSSNKLKLQSFDLSDGTELIAENIEVLAPGEILVMGKDLLNLLGVLTGIELKVTVKENENGNGNSLADVLKSDYEIELKTATQTVLLPTLSVKEFPAIPTITPIQLLQVTEFELYDALNKTIKVASPDETKQVITGINLRYNGKLALSATNGHCLTIAYIDLLNHSSFDSSITFNKNFATRLLKLLGPTKEETIALEIESNLIKASLVRDINKESVEINLLSRILDGTFPNAEKLLPNESSLKIVTNKEQLAQGFALSTLFSDQSKLLSIYEYLGENQQVIRAEKDANGRATQIIESQSVVGDIPIKIGVNPKYMQLILNSYSGSYVQLNFNSPQSPIVINGVNEQIESVSMIMPITLVS